MNLRPCIVVIVVSLLASVTRAAGPAPQAKPTLWVVPHTHWEGAVFKTREEYLEMGLPNILKAMRLLREQPSYTFTLDQVAYVKPFLERFPEEAADFRKYLAEGRLYLAGALDVMPDVNMPGGETFVRQMQYGKGYYRRSLGVDVTSAWLVDTFGHHAQMPQLLALGGYKAFWFSRGVPKPDFPSELLWEGIDGTRIPAFWLPYSYGLFYSSPADPEKFAEFAKARYGLLDPNSSGPDRVGLSGADVSEPEEHLVPMIEAFNRREDAPFTMRMAVPAQFEAIAARRADRPVFRGEFNPIFQGTYSSRIELKQWMRSSERRLLAAEQLGALAAALGRPADRAAIWRAWEPVLFNETHDLASGVMTDHVYNDTVRSYEFSRRVADEQIDAAWDAFTARIPTEGRGVPIVVYNTLGWPRTDVAEVTIGTDASGITSFVLEDDAGRAVPNQLVEANRDRAGGLRTARIAFTARDVPALGYRTYHAVPRHDDNPPSPQGPSGTLTNDLYRIAFDPETGAMTSLKVKGLDWEVLAGHGNVVARQDDKGDLWELYRGLDGGSKIAMTTKQAVPDTKTAVLSDAEGGTAPGPAALGPVFSEFRATHSMGSGRFATTVRIYADLRRIEITTRLVNNEKFVRYQVLFPTTVQGGQSTHEIPFGAIERPNVIEFPAQNWVDHSDGKRGLALLNIGLPGNVVTDGTMMLSLLRAHTLGAYGFGGGYEPGMSSDSGYQLGLERTMRYALVPHAGDWRAAAVYRDGLEFNHPLIVRKVEPHAGPLPARWGLLDVSAPTVVVSSLKPSRDDMLALRLYEATGRAVAGVTVRLHARLRSAQEANLLEDPGRALEVKDDAVRLDLHPFEIKTLLLRVEPSWQSALP
jgi:alpha-mannosidase